MRTWFLLFTLALSLNTFALNNDSSQAYVKSGLEKKARNDLQSAFWDFQKAYNFDNTDTAAVSNYAEALLGRRQYAQALQKYTELITLGSTSPAAYKQLFLLSYNLRKYEDAVKYGTLLKTALPNEPVMLIIGKSYQGLEDYANALPALDKAMAEDPLNGEIPYAKARIYADMGNSQNALNNYKEAIGLAPNNYDWMYEAAIAFYEAGDAKSSLDYMLRAAEKGHPLTSDFKLNLAIAFKNNGRLSEATTKIDELLKLKPTDMQALTMGAKASYLKKNYDSAMHYLNKLIAVDNKAADAIYMLGMCYLSKGNNEEADKKFNEAISINDKLVQYRGKPLTGYY